MDAFAAQNTSAGHKLKAWVIRSGCDISFDMLQSPGPQTDTQEFRHPLQLALLVRRAGFALRFMYWKKESQRCALQPSYLLGIGLYHHPGHSRNFAWCHGTVTPLDLDKTQSARGRLILDRLHVT
jgi:hypothetical protein